MREEIKIDVTDKKTDIKVTHTLASEGRIPAHYKDELLGDLIPALQNFEGVVRIRK